MLSYKYAIVDSESGALLRWEADGHNLLLPPNLAGGAVVQVSDVWEVSLGGEIWLLYVVYRCIGFFHYQASILFMRLNCKRIRRWVACSGLPSSIHQPLPGQLPPRTPPVAHCVSNDGHAWQHAFHAAGRRSPGASQSRARPLHRPPPDQVSIMDLWVACCAACLETDATINCHQPLHPLILHRRDWQIEEGEQLCVTGGAPQLGNWQLQECLPLQPVGRGTFEVEVR